MLDVEGGVVFHLVLAELGGRDLICNFRPGENRHRLGRYLVGPSYGDEEKVGNREPPSSKIPVGNGAPPLGAVSQAVRPSCLQSHADQSSTGFLA